MDTATRTLMQGIYDAEAAKGNYPHWSATGKLVIIEPDDSPDRWHVGSLYPETIKAHRASTVDDARGLWSWVGFDSLAEVDAYYAICADLDTIQA